MKKITHTLFTLALLWLGMSSSFAQLPEILSDIDSRPRPSDPRELTVIDGKIYFASNIYNRGFQLSVYDGNSTENILFREGNTGSSFYPNEFVSIGTDIFFPSRTDEYGREIYKYDGNEVTVIDANPGSNDSSPTNLIVYNSKLYFNATDGVNGFELWEYDGTDVTMVEDIQLGAGTSNPSKLFVYNNELLFSANDGTSGYELWTYDGTNVTMVEDINPGAGHSNPDHFTIYNDKLYFAAANVAWVYDGSILQSLADVTGQTVGTDPRYFTVYNDELYFNSLLAASGAELWKYDGTGVGMVANINAGSASSFPRFLTVGAGNLFFDAETDNGRELWKFDGTTATEYDLNAGTPHSYPSNFTAVGDKIYFRATTVNDGQELWMHDGTSATLIDINEGSGNSTPNYLVAFDNEVLFSANNGDGVFLWSYDGTNLNRILTNTNTYGSTADSPIVFNGKLYFQAETNELGRELYDYDGSVLNVTEINPGEGAGDPSNFFIHGDKLYFSAYDGSNGYEMFVSDGTEMTMIDINPGSGSSFPQQFTAFNGDIYFRATDGTNGVELWKYDGISATMVHDINPGGDSSPQGLIVYNSKLYFSANDGINDYELWVYNGTNTTMVEDINITGGSNPDNFIIVNDKLYFTADDGGVTYGRENWKFDGTNLVAIDIYAGTPSSFPSQLTNYNDELYFTAYDDTNGEELRKYDGTTVTTIDIYAGSASSYAYAFTIHNELLYFSAYEDINGNELRSYDGTNLNLVVDYSDNDDTSLDFIFSYGPMLYLNYYDYSDQTYKLTSYNGTEITYLKQMALQEFDDYGTPTEYGNYMYFSADSEEYGDVEMWRIRKISEETDILTFELSEQLAEATINATNHTVVIETVFGTDISSLSPTITVSDYASINPVSGATVDFSSPVVFTVTSEFGNTQDWTISVSAETNDAPTDLSLSANTIDELNEVDDIIGSFSTTDPNISDFHTYSLVAGTGDTDNASFDISGSNLIALEAFDFETKSSYSVRVQTNDGRGGIFENEFAISVNDLSSLEQTITFNSLTDKTFGDDSFELTASASSGLNIEFTSSDDNIVSISGSLVTIVGAGTVNITTSQSGDTDFAAATGVVQSLTVNKADQTVTLDAISNKDVSDAPFEAVTSATSGLSVNLSVSGPASITGTTITLDGTEGIVTVTASQSGDDNYNSASDVEVSFEVTSSAVAQTITFNAIENQFFEAGSLTLSATASSGLEVSYELVSGPATVSGNVVSFSDLGTVVVSANQAGNDSFLAATSVEQSFDIITVTGVDNVTSALLIYPNPVTDVLTIQTQQEDISIQLLNMNGTQVMSIRANAPNSISHLSDGIYFLRISAGENYTTHKIIKN
ncbi:T9SS type A sorting domain-containing protein [Fulvivirga sp.]|uniref:T9SS type A sorting domain-containing protein n=1 Tax=Fulvivirga sp. TaxID=1931237 RepID=UPI0032EC2333